MTDTRAGRRGDSMADARALGTLARALADESRATMCLAMLDGSPWTVTELAGAAGVTLATASEHADRLVAAKLVVEERAGRCRYLRLSGPEVAQALEDLTGLLGTPQKPGKSLRQVGERRRLAAARTCYDHLAGRLGVAVMDAMVNRRLLDTGSGLSLTRRGEEWLAEIGVDVQQLKGERRTLLRECLDWTERRPHLAGSAGAALCDRFLENRWVRRTDSTRRLELTAPGQRAVHAQLGVTAADLAVSALVVRP